jgi:radical SAM-linked protein
MQLEDRFLQSDYKRAMRNKLSPPCGKPAGAQVHPADLQTHDADTRRLVCYHCGVACDMKAMRDERREFLEKLGAFEPRRGDRARQAREQKQERIARGAAPHRLEQGEPLRARFQLRKLGADAMTSHLDLVRKLPRIFRRAGIELFYTEGFHPKPALTFGPALPLGVQSLGEVFEVKLVRPSADAERELLHPGRVLDALNAVAESGLDFVSCEFLESGQARLGKSLEAAEYLVQPEPHARLDAERIRTALESFHRAETWSTRLLRKRKEHEVDLCEVVEAIESADPDDRTEIEAALTANWQGTIFRMRLRLEGTAQVRPAEVLRSILDIEDLEVLPVRVLRVGFTLAPTADPGLAALSPG